MLLNNCPFCGSEDIQIIHEIYTNYDSESYKAECQNCYACGGEGLTEKEAINNWNMRSN